MSGCGPLRNGNPRGNPETAPRCGARTRAGVPCRSPAMANGRCRMHGGASTGATSAEGKARIRAAVLQHGLFTAEARQELREDRAKVGTLRALIATLRPLIRKAERARR